MISTGVWQDGRGAWKCQRSGCRASVNGNRISGKMLACRIAEILTRSFRITSANASEQQEIFLCFSCLTPNASSTSTSQSFCSIVLSTLHHHSCYYDIYIYYPSDLFFVLPFFFPTSKKLKLMLMQMYSPLISLAPKQLFKSTALMWVFVHQPVYFNSF